MPSSTVNPFGASGSALGYLYQCRWALATFLRRLAPGDTVDVAIEKLDDVSFEKSGTSIELIQTKHHVDTAANLTDSSPDLWKSIRVWAEAVRRGDVRLPGVLLTLVTTSTASPGSVTAMLRSGRARQVAEAHTRLMAVARTSTSTTNEASYDAFLSLPDAERAAVVESIHIVDREPNAVDLKAEIARLVQYATDDSHLTAFVERLEGWWVDRVVEHLTGTVAGPIAGADLLLKLTDLRHAFQPDNLPLDFVIAMPPDGADPDGDTRVFVQQLKIIAANNDRIRFAITDYFRAFSQRSRWLRDDLVRAGELELYEGRLIEELERHRATIQDEGPPPTSNAEKAEFGRRVLRWVEKDAHIPIRERVVDPYVMRGSYHMLADRERLGWHPDFITRLRALLSGATPAQP